MPYVSHTPRESTAIVALHRKELGARERSGERDLGGDDLSDMFDYARAAAGSVVYVSLVSSADPTHAVESRARDCTTRTSSTTTNSVEPRLRGLRLAVLASIAWPAPPPATGRGSKSRSTSPTACAAAAST